MSEFAKLRATRQAKEKEKSYVSRNTTDKGQHIENTGQFNTSSTKDVEMADAAASAQANDNLYFVWPTSDFEICVSLGDSVRGRGVFSRKQYRPGNILVSVRPNVSVLSIGHLSKHCSACTSPSQANGNGLKRCAGCKTVHYCSPECQTRDWSMHKAECTALQSWAEAAPSPEVAVPSDAVRCLGRILWTKKKSGGRSTFGKEIDAMQSHRTFLQPSTSELHVHLAHALVRYLSLSSSNEMAAYGLTSIADLVDLISRFTTNTVALTTSSLSPVGACISPSIALLNHSCDPNVVIVFPRASPNPPLLQVVAIKSINPGEELLTAYIDTTLPREERQTTLKETYNFDCSCPPCSSSGKVVDPREAFLCPTRKEPSGRVCNGVCEIPKEGSINSRCNVCNSSIGSSSAEEISDAIRISLEGLEKARDLQYKDPERAIRLTSNLIGILTSTGLAPGAHPLLALSRLHSSILIENLPDLSNVICQAPPLPSDPLLESTSLAVSASRQSFAQLEDQKEERKILQNEAERRHAEGAQQKLDDAIRAALRTSTGLAAVLVPGHPLIGLALAELGKLLSVDEPVPKYLAGTSTSGAGPKGAYPPSGPARLRLARETLIRARMELMVGFGRGNEGGEVGKEVREWLVRVEKELQVWHLGIQGASQS